MKTEWDYSDLADFYDQRPDYAGTAIDALVERSRVAPASPVADIGAGTGKLTKLLLERGLTVDAVEPNDNMRAFGSRNTAGGRVTWSEGTGERTGLPSGRYRLVAFGSSFNVTDRPRALIEAARLLGDGGWFACMWNHRDLQDPIQKRVEEVIKSLVPAYGYGTRREDQTEVIRASGLWGPVEAFEGSVVWPVPRADYMGAWRSHATLQRQAGERFAEAIEAIDRVVPEGATLRVPYTTRGWCAPLLRR